jgi:hypothetical protein
MSRRPVPAGIHLAAQEQGLDFRHGCSRTPAARFFSLTCSAVRLAPEDRVSAPKPREAGKVEKLPTNAVIRDIDTTVFLIINRGLLGDDGY